MTRVRRAREMTSLYTITCAAAGGKRCYPTRVQARKARNRIRGGRCLNIYRCDACSGYHLGHLPRAITAGIAAKAEVFGA